MTQRLILRHGDCVEVLKGCEDGSIGAIVSDPPYDLTAVSRGGSARQFVDNPYGRSRVGTDRKGFMGKSWDGTGIAFSADLWDEVYRVLRPGGVVKAFSGTRTFHRMAYAMQKAGFVGLRVESWNYGSGFPKSMDIGKALDKIDRSEAAQARARTFTAWMRSTGITARQIDDATGTHMGNHYTTHPTQPSVATSNLFDLLRPLLPPVPEEIEEIVRSRTVESENMKRRAVVGEYKDTSPGCNMRTGMLGTEKDEIGKITVPYTDAARQWDGWGTALKPAWEPVVVGRKPE
jgi:hypothetical protein